MATMWVTGAHGFMGRHLARHLHASGHCVRGLGHGTWPEADAASWGVAQWINGEIDAANLEVLRQSGELPEVIFHLAGGSSVGASLAMPLEDFGRTVSTTARLLEWLRSVSPATHVVAASSAAVYGSGHQGKISETAGCSPYSPYGYHKAMMESVLKSYAENFGMRCSVVRLFSVYGPWLRKQLLWDVCSRLHGEARALSMSGTGKELRDWTEVSDVVRLLAAVASARGESFAVWNGGSGRAESVSEIVSHLTAAWGTSVPVEFSGDARPGDPFSLVADPAGLQSLGFEWRIAVSEGIARYVRWFRSAVT